MHREENRPGKINTEVLKAWCNSYNCLARMTVRPEAHGFTVEYISTHTNHSLSLSKCISFYHSQTINIRSDIASKVSQGVTVGNCGEDTGWYR